MPLDTSCQFYYGAGNVWGSTWISGLSVVECTNEQFGDPFQGSNYYIQGMGRHCCRGECQDRPKGPCYGQFC